MEYPQVAEKMIDYFSENVDRINHALKVYSFADIITTKQSPEKRTQKIIQLAAILHDIGIMEAEKKYNSTQGKYQEQEGPRIARKILSDFDIPEDIVERVCYIIGNHHSYDKIDGLDFQILVEADFLVNIFDEDMSAQQIKSVKANIFETESGKSLLMKMYLE